MTPRLWVLSLAPVLAASAAYAQAPGEVEATAPQQPRYAQPAPPPAYAPPPRYAQPPYPPPPPPYAQPAAPAAVPVMAHRWSIGLALGGMGVAPDGAPAGSESRFRVGEIALRYRASRRIEIALAASGGREVLEDSTDGDLATGSVMLALRYRFLPEHRWSWFLTAGLGGTVVAPHTSDADQRDAAQRPLGMAGVGIERRFRQLALTAELRMLGLGQRKDASGDVPVAEPAPAPGTPTMPPGLLPAPSAPAYADRLSGGMITIGASYYF